MGRGEGEREIEMTHEMLVKRARSWLFARCPVVVSELASGRETADAIGLGHGQSMLIECKVSRSDFLADGKKFFRQSHEYGMGNLRYYLCPSGLIKADEIPENWGLLYCAERKISIIKEARHLAKDHQAEVSLLISILRRVHACPDAVSVKFYNIETKNRSTVLLRSNTAPFRAA